MYYGVYIGLTPAFIQFICLKLYIWSYMHIKGKMVKWKHDRKAKQNPNLSFKVKQMKLLLFQVKHSCRQAIYIYAAYMGGLVNTSHSYSQSVVVALLCKWNEGLQLWICYNVDHKILYIPITKLALTASILYYPPVFVHYTWVYAFQARTCLLMCWMYGKKQTQNAYTYMHTLHKHILCTREHPLKALEKINIY